MTATNSDSPQPSLRRRPDIIDRLLSKIVIDEKGCWLWQDSIGSNGYATVSYKNRGWRAHRLSYTIFIGEIPEGLVTDHLCRTRSCINPDHLEAVTFIENVRRGEAGIYRRNRRLNATACTKGHPYVEGSYRPAINHGRPYRRCSLCQKAQNPKRNAKYRAKMLLKRQLAEGIK